MDCDLQDDPKYFHKLFKKIEEGYDLVLTKKINRKHGYFKNLLAHMFHRIFNWLKNENGTFSNPNIGAFSIFPNFFQIMLSLLFITYQPKYSFINTEIIIFRFPK